MEKRVVKSPKRIIIELDGQDYPVDIPTVDQLKADFFPGVAAIQAMNAKITGAKTPEEIMAASQDKTESMRALVEKIVPAFAGKTGGMPLAQVDEILTILMECIVGKAAPSPDQAK